MDELTINVNVEYDDTEEDIEVSVDLDEYAELEAASEKIKYIKCLAQKKVEKTTGHKKVKVLFDYDDLKDLESDIDDFNDTSDWHPNETYDEFMEHEDFE